jgi:hypothetical protein
LLYFGEKLKALTWAGVSSLLFVIVGKVTQGQRRAVNSPASIYYLDLIELSTEEQKEQAAGTTI